MELDTQQEQFFRSFGFLKIPGFFSADEIAQIRAEFDRSMAEAYAHMPFDGSRRHWLTMMGSSRTPFLASLLENPRILGIAEQLFGDVVPFMVDGNRYVGDTAWHPDSTANGGIKLFLYLEPLTAATGALRVIPGSHRKELSDVVRGYIADHNPAIPDVPWYAIETQPGDLAMFDFNIWHCAVGGAPGRSMCTIAYYREPADDNDVELIRRHASGCFPQLTEGFGIQDIGPFFDDWYDNPSGSPVREKLIDRATRVGIPQAWSVGGSRVASA